jgi:hypothetical protein
MFLFTPILFAWERCWGPSPEASPVFLREMMQQRKVRPPCAPAGFASGGMAVILAKGGTALVMIVVTLINIYS